MYCEKCHAPMRTKITHHNRFKLMALVWSRCTRCNELDFVGSIRNFFKGL